MDVVPAENLNQIDKIRPVGLTLAGIVIALSVFFAVGVYCYRNVSVIKASQPIFLIMVCFGTLLLGSTIIPLSIDDSIASTRGCSIACMAAPWLLSLGFTTVFAALYSKIWRINKIFRHAKGFKRVKVSEKDVLIPFLVLLVLNVSLLTAWTAVDPLHWVREYQEGRESLNSSFGYCKSENGSISMGFGISLVLVNLLALILANVEAYKARNISDEYSESKYIGVAMALTLQIFVIGIPILFLVGENPTAKFFVSSGTNNHDTYDMFYILQQTANPPSSLDFVYACNHYLNSLTVGSLRNNLCNKRFDAPTLVHSQDYALCKEATKEEGTGAS